MRKLNIILLFLGCFLFVVGCDDSTEPNTPKETTIQNPPPKDRFYLAFEIDGKPIINEHGGGHLYYKHSTCEFHDANTLYLYIHERYCIDSVVSDLEISTYIDLTNDLNKPIKLVSQTSEAGKTDHLGAWWHEAISRGKQWNEAISDFVNVTDYICYEPVSGTLTVTDFDYHYGLKKGHISGTFEFKGKHKETDKSVTNGSFNVFL